MSERAQSQTAISDLNQEEIDTLVAAIMEEGASDVTVYSAVKKLPDIEAGAGNVPEGLSRVCQKCGGEIDEDEEWFARFGHFYHGPDGGVESGPGCMES